MFSSDLSSFHVVPTRGRAGGIAPCGVAVFFTVTEPSARKVHSASCAKPALFEPVTSTAAITRTTFSSCGKTTLIGRAWYRNWVRPEA